MAAVVACLVLAGGFGAWRVFGQRDANGATGAPTGTALPVSCSKPATVRVAVAPDAVAVLSQLAQALSKHSDGPCAAFAIEPADGYAVSASLASPNAPDAWVTDSQEWITKASALLGRELTPGTPFASSGVVLAMPRQAAERLGNDVSWTNALTTAGVVRVPDPARSAVGNAVLGAVAPSMSAQGLRDLVTRLSRAGAATLAAATASTPPSSVAVTAAQLVAHNEQRPDRAMAAVAPAGGAATISYSLVAVSEEQPVQQLVAQLSAFLGSDEAKDALSEAGYAVPGNESPQLPTPLYGVIKAAPPPSAAVIASVRKEWSSLAPRSRSLLALSVSGSMLDRIDTGTRLQATQSAVLRAVGGMPAQSSVSLWAYSVHIGPDGFDYKVVMPYSTVGDARTTADLNKNVLALNRTIGGGRALYDTIAAAYGYAVGAYSPGADNAIVIVTDGANEDDYGDSLDTLKQRIATLRNPARPVRITIIGLDDAADKAALQGIVAATGGSYIEARSAAEISAAIASAVGG